jgi:hypothetical protein
MIATSRLIADLLNATKEGCPRCEDGTKLHQYAGGEYGHLVNNYGRRCYMAKTHQRIEELSEPNRHPASQKDRV